MSGTKQGLGVFSWEDVLAQRYLSNKPPALHTPTTPSSSTSRSSSSSVRRRKSTEHDTTLSSFTPNDREADEDGASFINGPFHSQSQCSLLTKLPAEVRLMTWEFALGGMRLHIVQRPGQRLGYVICPRPYPSPRSWNDSGQGIDVDASALFCEICYGGLPARYVRDNVYEIFSSSLRRGQERRRSLLALPKACKQIYFESIHMIYTLNTFEFSNTWSLTYLEPTLPRRHWDSICHVELLWAFPGHWLPSKDPVKRVYFSAGRTQWEETCQALTEMQGLRAFELSLPGSWFCEPVEKVLGFLNPLRDLKLDLRRGNEKMKWVVKLPRQPYYLGQMNGLREELRLRGVNCDVSVV